MLSIAIVWSIILILILISPFFVGRGGVLQESSSINSVERLESLRHALLKRFLQDEGSFKRGELSARSWEKRRSYLTNRYVDVTRRSDYLGRLSARSQERKGGHQ
jgi:hypothetical protein